MTTKNPKLLLMMLLSVSVLGESAYAACSTPTGAEGQLKYDTTAKQLAVCDGTSWVAVGGGGGGITGGTPPGTWNAGSNSYRASTACNVNVGQECGGGIYAGDYNLVIAKPENSAAITWRTTNDISDFFPTGDDERYGSRITELFGGNPLYPAFASCQSAVHSGQTDWYVPTSYEAQIIAANMSPINNGMAKYSGTSLPTGAWHLTANETFRTDTIAYGTGYANWFMLVRGTTFYNGAFTPASGMNIYFSYNYKNQNGRLRCVRRN